MTVSVKDAVLDRWRGANARWQAEVPEAPHLVTPAALHLAEGELGQVRMLVPQQVADETRP